jgi:membrane protein DedA with SNARE-associated domain
MDEFLTWLTLSLQSFDALTVYGVGFLVIVICGLGVPIPEDVTLLTMGYLTYLPLPDGSPRPHANIVLASAIAFVACMVGDGIMFSIGRRYGMSIVRHRPFRWVLTPARIERARRTVEHHGPKMLFAARFMPGIRSVGFFTAGSLGTPYLKFLTYDGLAGAISVPLFVFAGWHWGADIDHALTLVRRAEHGMLALVVVVTIALIAKAWWNRRRDAETVRSSDVTRPAE